MSSSTHHETTTWRIPFAPSRLLGPVALIALLALHVPAGANGFQATILQSSMTFSVNGHDYMSGANPFTDANLRSNGLLATGTDSTNHLDVGFDKTPGNLISLKIGSGVVSSDTLQVYGIRGVLLEAAEPNTNSKKGPVVKEPKSTIDRYGSATLPTWTGLQKLDGSGLVAYSDAESGNGFKPSANWLAWKAIGAGPLAGDLSWTTEKGRYGTFEFDNLSFGTATSTHMGMDVLGDLYDSHGRLMTQGWTGFLYITGASGSGDGGGGEPTPAAAPETPSLLLLAFGALPLILTSVYRCRLCAAS